MRGEESSQIKSKYPGVTSFHEGFACVCVSVFGTLLRRSNVACLHQLASVCKQCPPQGHGGKAGPMMGTMKAESTEVKHKKITDTQG